MLGLYKKSLSCLISKHQKRECQTIAPCLRGNQRRLQLSRRSSHRRSYFNECRTCCELWRVEADKSRICVQSTFVRKKKFFVFFFKSSEIDLQRTLSRVCLCMNEERDVPRLSNCSCYPGVISRCFSAIKYERCLLSSNAPGQAEMIYIVSAKANGGVEDHGLFQSRPCEFGVIITNVLFART